MLAVENLIRSLSMEGEPEGHNEDFDLGEVMKFCHDNAAAGHKLQYSDGTEENFSFDRGYTQATGLHK